MKIFLISQEVNNEYDTYDSAVVVAPDKETAQKIDPTNYRRTFVDENDIPHSWCHPHDVQVELIGDAFGYTDCKVILSSFNAG